ncbi:protein kinase domain-containing protein [Sphingosinicella sp.]|uniref:protein kinase domain-containing protein n=1 Tax=Sphingosinicella sp. TaxID=1917971 RepID=UPI00403847D2
MNAPTGPSLQPGQPFLTVNHRRGTVGQLLGAGGQGECYHVTVDGLPFALKWYHRNYVEIDTGLRGRLERAVRRGAPTGNFLWPFDLVEIAGSGSFGYFMPLRGHEYVSIRDLIAAPPKRVEIDLGRRAKICVQLAESFLELHASGFCYQDINFGNIFFDPATARILICDNDNVNIDGADASIYGTRKFMAPEVTRRETLPNSRTDLYSMSVLFFYTLLGWHPLDGRREHEVTLMDANAEHRLYGGDPLFIFDPANDENGPVQGYHDAIVARWNSLPSTVRTLFTRAFTKGLVDPGARVLETQWRTALNKVPGAVFQCGYCGFEHVAEIRGKKATARHDCLACRQPMTPPFFLLRGTKSERLGVGDMIGGGKGRVEVHPTRAELVGLRNLTQGPWQVQVPGAGSTHEVPPGKTVRLMDGVRIDFGGDSGVVTVAEKMA